MSFRTRLSLFFVLIVVVPMVALVFLLVQVSDDSKTGKADARLAAGVGTGLTLYRDYAADSRGAARRLASDPSLGAAIAAGDPARAAAAARRVAAATGASFLRITGSDGRVLAVAGSGRPIGVARVVIRGPRGRLGTLLASAHTAAAYAHAVRRLSGRPAVVLRSGRTIAATASVDSRTLPAAGRSAEVTAAHGAEYRARTVSLGDARGGTALVLLGPPGAGGFEIRPAVAVGLAAFFALAFALTFALMRSLGGQHEEVSEQAATDVLTGLANRRRFRELLAKEAERSRRFGRPVSLLMIDIDDFKRVNDAHGHPQGDEVLRMVGRLLSSESREIDEAARYGGEELAVILPETGPSGAHEVAERIRGQIERAGVPLLHGKGELTITASVGTASIPESADGAEALVAAADDALYRAKRAGKNRTEQAGVGGSRRAKTDVGTPARTAK